MSSDSEDSSSGEDVPLAALGGKHLRPPGINSDESSSEEEAEFDENAEEEEEEPSSEEDNDDDFIADESDEEEELQGAESESESESDSDDDVPLASLKSPRGKKAAAGKKKEKKPAAKKKTAAKPKKKAAAKTKKAAAKKANGSKQSAASSSSEPTNASGHLYAKSDKGRLIQAVLCRWWYVVTWPDPAALPPVPRHYDALDGFPGVYVCTSGDDVGKLTDHRDPATCPSFANFAKKTSDELVEMLVEAITNQKEQLIAAEGEDTDTEKELDELEKWARRLNTAKADRQAEKVLKAAKLAL